MFKSYFLEWMAQYMPGTTMNILNSNTTGAVTAIITDRDPETCQ